MLCRCFAVSLSARGWWPLWRRVFGRCVCRRCGARGGFWVACEEVGGRELGGEVGDVGGVVGGGGVWVIVGRCADAGRARSGASRWGGIVSSSCVSGWWGEGGRVGRARKRGMGELCLLSQREAQPPSGVRGLVDN